MHGDVLGVWWLRRKLVRISFLKEVEGGIPERAEALGYLLDESDEFVGLFVERYVPAHEPTPGDAFFALRRESILRFEDVSEEV